MASHPNRGERGIGNPTKEEVRAARDAAGLTQTAAGELVHTTCRVWQQYEAGDRRMHPSMWQLFRILTGQEPVTLPPASPPNPRA